MKEISKKQFIEHSKKLLELYPNNENLKKNIEYLENGGYEKEVQGINKEYELYQKLIVEYYTELHLAFNKAYENSIDRNGLINIELKSIKLLLDKGKKSDLTIFDWTNVFKLPPKKAKEINRFLIKGLEMKKLFLGEVLDFEEFENYSKVRALLFYKQNLEELEQRMIINKQTISNEELHLKILKNIWLVNAKIDLEVFLKKGIEKKIWNENYELITKRDSIYGSGKTLLASLSIALKDWCINSETDYNVIGEAFCSFFKIEIKPTTVQKYKSFQSGNPKHIENLKRTFNITT